MARKHARLLVSIWRDPDWLDLTCYQQVTYLSVLSSPDLSWCGVAPHLPQRFVGSSDGTLRRTVDAIKALDDARFLILDRETDEICVRSFVRHDDILKQPNVAKAMVDALGRVHSDTIRDAICQELCRAYAEGPALKGWPAVREVAPDLHEWIITNPSGNPSANPSGKAFANPSPITSGKPLRRVG